MRREQRFLRAGPSSYRSDSQFLSPYLLGVATGPGSFCISLLDRLSRVGGGVAAGEGDALADLFPLAADADKRAPVPLSRDAVLIAL